VPDVAVLNEYLAGSKALGFTSGVARSSGHLEYSRDILSGKVDLAGEQISGALFGETIAGKLVLGLKIASADLEDRKLDLSGTHLRMQEISGGQGKKSRSLLTQLLFPQARFESELPLAQLRDRSGPPPISAMLTWKEPSPTSASSTAFSVEISASASMATAACRQTCDSAGATSHPAARSRSVPTSLPAGFSISRQRAQGCSRPGAPGKLPRRVPESRSPYRIFSFAASTKPPPTFRENAWTSRPPESAWTRTTSFENSTPISICGERRSPIRPFTTDICRRMRALRSSRAKVSSRAVLSSKAFPAAVTCSCAPRASR
jgi:hypothetical protein